MRLGSLGFLDGVHLEEEFLLDVPTITAVLRAALAISSAPDEKDDEAAELHEEIVTPWLALSALSYATMHRLPNVEVNERIALDGQLNELTRALGTCEKLLRTPIPLGYTRYPTHSSIGETPPSSPPCSRRAWSSRSFAVSHACSTPRTPPPPARPPTARAGGSVQAGSSWPSRILRTFRGRCGHPPPQPS